MARSLVIPWKVFSPWAGVFIWMSPGYCVPQRRGYKEAVLQPLCRHAAVSIWAPQFKVVPLLDLVGRTYAGIYFLVLVKTDLILPTQTLKFPFGAREMMAQ